MDPALNETATYYSTSLRLDRNRKHWEALIFLVSVSLHNPI